MFQAMLMNPHMLGQRIRIPARSRIPFGFAQDFTGFWIARRSPGGNLILAAAGEDTTHHQPDHRHNAASHRSVHDATLTDHNEWARPIFVLNAHLENGSACR